MCGLAPLALVLEAMLHIPLTIPSMYWKAKTRTADLQVGPAIDGLTLKKHWDSSATGEKLPTSIGLLAHKAIACACHSVTLARGRHGCARPEFGDKRRFVCIHHHIMRRTVATTACFIGADRAFRC
jgi:hypothetical protein